MPVLVLPLPQAQGQVQVIEQSLEIMRWALTRSDPAQWLVVPEALGNEMAALVVVCDGEFKHHLDRYKYPGRYPGAVAEVHRAAAAGILTQWDARLREQPFFSGSRPVLADRAVAPFVRQFAQVDTDWFQAQPWPGLQAWLQAFLESPLLEQVMPKFPRWQAGNPPVLFP